MYSVSSQLYSWGLNVNGQLGILSTENQHLPTLVPTSSSIISISCGGQFTGFVTESKEVFLCGSNKKNQLGIVDKNFKNDPKKSYSLQKDISDFYPSPINLKLDFKITSISCGDWHTLLLDESGIVYATGYNKTGCLGLGDDLERSEFQPLIFDSPITKIKKIDAGRNISLFLTEEDILLSSGSSWLNGNSDKNQLKPMKIKDLSMKVNKFSAGYTRCAAIDENGMLYIWKKLQKPTKIEIPFEPKIAQVSCSKGEKKSHIGCVDIEGNLYTWGSGYKGKLGHGDLEDRLIPTKISFFDENKIRVKKFVAGGIHSACLTEEGKIYTWGCGSDGRLGHKESENHRYLFKEMIPRLVEFFEERIISDFDSSYYHMAAVIVK